MKKMAGLALLLCIGNWCLAQHQLLVVVKGADTQERLAGASVIWINSSKEAVADSSGTVVMTGIPAGKQVFVFRHTGYREYRDTLVFPRAGDTLNVLLENEEEEMEEVVIAATRSGRTIQNLPTRVEVIDGEELEEKGNMRPGDIRMMLNESTGIQTQQVSATSANASIRIQGLDGRYTQLLKDGFPLFAGFSGGLGLLQTPPLDLKQVEVIKGASSTLYGGGAIAGLVNLVSKVPAAERELKFLINGTSAGGLDMNGFYSQHFTKVGVTVFASRNTSKAYDPADIGFTAIPQTERYVFNPKLFVDISAATKLNVGVNTSFEDRTGGDMEYIKGNASTTHSYFEKNRSRRFSTQLTLEHALNNHSGLTIKNAVSYFNRFITIPDYVFDGRQWSTYSEIAWHNRLEKMDWVAGVNGYTDCFREHPEDAFPKRDDDQHTVGGFVQHTWKFNRWLQTETGLRGDYITNYGWAWLPRVSALFTIAPGLTSRLGGGLGYKTPTVFTEETERIQYRYVLPVSPDANRLEKSYGVNFDVNYRVNLSDKMKLTINQLFFYTRINHPLLLRHTGVDQYQLVNATSAIDTKGGETNVKLSYEAIKLFVGYTYTDGQTPLTARHRLNNVLMYEVEDQWKIGLEAYYYSKQTLSDGTTGKAYWTCGFMAEKLWEWFSLFINFENFMDTRQTKFGSIYTGTVTNPVFKDIYAPLDGFVVNGGLKLNL